MSKEEEIREAMIGEYKKRNAQLAAELKVARQTLNAVDSKVEELEKDVELLTALLFEALEGHNIRIDRRMRERLDAQIGSGVRADFSENPSGQPILLWTK